MSKAKSAQLWSQIAPDFDQIGPPFFAQTGRRLVELLAIGEGEFVLDVASGRGATLFPAAEKVGENGRVIGTDLAAGMLHTLVTDKQPIDLVQMDGEYLAFASAAFDVVLCGHAIFYFPQALTQFGRILRLGGRLGLTIVAAGTFDWLWQLLASFLPAEDWPPTDKAAIDTPPGLQQRLAQAGFEQIEVVAETAVYIYANEETWWQNLWALGTRRTLAEMEPAMRQDFQTALYQKLQDFKQPDGVHIPCRTLLATAVKPEMRADE